MPDLSIQPLNTGYLATVPGKHLYHYSVAPYRRDIPARRMDIPVFCFLVRSGGSLMLIDTGMSWTERALEYHLPLSRQPAGMAVHERLAGLGLSPRDIDAVLLTHLHWDHSFYLEKFSKADFYVHEKEYAFALDPIPLYYRSYEHPIIGVTRPFEGISFKLLSGDTEIMPGVSMFETPGHTPGHMSVALESSAGEYICAGDALFTIGNLKPVPELHYNISPLGIYQDSVAAWRSLELVARRAEDPSFILCCHCPELEERLKTEPVLGRRL